MIAADLLPGGRLCIGDSVEARATYVAPGGWNGWECPYLDRAAVLALSAALEAAAIADPSAGLVRLRLTGDALEALDPEGDEPSTWQTWEAAPVLVDGVAHWTPGAWGWTWYRLDDDAVLRWSVSEWGHTPSAAFYDPKTTADHAGRPLFATAEAAAAWYRETLPAGATCGPAWEAGRLRTCILRPGHLAGAHVWQEVGE